MAAFVPGTPCRCCGEPMAASRRAAAGTQERRHVSRGLCGSCYTSERRDGNLDKYPRLQNGRDDVLTAYAAHRAQHPHATQDEIAATLGIPRSTLSMHLVRGAQVGDRRSDCRPSLVIDMPSPRDGGADASEHHSHPVVVVTN